MGDWGEVGREDGGAAICVDPEKGATSPFGDRSPPNGISIHAPAKGATKIRLFSDKFRWYFNPRSREGSDARRIPRHGRNGRISIHAPVKGATLSIRPHAPAAFISIHAPVKGATLVICTYIPFVKFQSTLPRRERLQANCSYIICDPFQSTLPRRERRSTAQCMRLSCRHFNPRSREGSDWINVL